MVSTFALLSVCVLAIIVIAITMVIISYNSDGSGSGENGVRVYYSFGTVLNPRIEPGSRNTSGSVIAKLSGAGQFEIIIRYGGQAPKNIKAVILTAGTPSTGVPLSDLVLTVDNITSNGFEIIGKSPAETDDGVLFYYMVM